MRHSNKQLLLALVLAAFACATVAAHEPLVPLLPGQMDLSLNFQPSEALSTYTSVEYNPDATWKRVQFMVAAGDPNGVFPRFSSIFEIGLLPGWSFGLITDQPNGLINLINGEEFGSVSLGLHTTLHLVNSDLFHWYVGARAVAWPLIASEYRNPAVDCFLLTSAGIRIANWHKGGLYAYLDLKGNTRLINQLFASPQQVIRNVIKPNLPGAMDNAILEWYPLYRIHAATGLDLQWGPIVASIGWNIPLADFTFEHGYLGTSSFDNPVNLEISARYRFGPPPQ
jgi:hypothetical protein